MSKVVLKESGRKDINIYTNAAATNVVNQAKILSPANIKSAFLSVLILSSNEDNRGKTMQKAKITKASIMTFLRLERRLCLCVMDS